MRPRAPAPLRLPRRRYSVPETTMRKCLLAREKSEMEDEPSVISGPTFSPRELERRAGLLRRLGAPAACCCSLDGSQPDTSAPPATPNCSSEAPMELQSIVDSPSINPSDMSCVASLPPPDLLEIVVSETSPPAQSYPTRTSGSRSTDCNLNIDEYVSNILVDSLNSLTDRLESMTISVGGDGRISVVEKEIKVKLQNTGINTVVHLSPTSNNQIIFGNEELYERDAVVVPPAPLQRLFAAGAETGARPRPPSPCVSLVDSLDDPSSPRTVPPPPAPNTLCPLSEPSDNVHKEKCESFFVRMNDDNLACEKENIVVADHMPEKIKQRLVRRHRRREMRAQGVRRSAARRGLQREAQRQCAALVDALIDDAIARIAREEYRCARIARRRDNSLPDENMSRIQTTNSRAPNLRAMPECVRRRLEPTRASQPLYPPLQLPPPPPRDRGPRRLYHKSEIHDGGKCIEILEIVEYANASRSSSETNSDDSISLIKSKKSRIPVPIQDKSETTRVRRSSVPPPATSVALGGPAVARRSSVPGVGPAAHALPSGSGTLRFERVFDVIPEERSSLSLESASEEPPSVLPLRRSAATSPRRPAGSSEEDTLVGRAAGCDDRCEGLGRRSVGTQWTRSPRNELNSTDMVKSEEEGIPAAAQADDRSSSESESACESRAGAPRPDRRRAHGRRADGRPLPLAPSPPPPLPPQTEPAITKPPLNESGAEGWSLTLAGSCRAALPASLDLRLRFPPADRAADRVPAARRRHDAAPAQDTERSTRWSESVSQSPAHRGRAGRARGAGGAALAAGSPPDGYSTSTSGAHDHVLPALTAPARRHSTQRRRSHCRSPSARPAPAPPPPPPRSVPAPTNPCAGCRCCAGALAVLGCAIVPERRAAPAARRRRHAARARL